jgi:hypothetical protein
LTLEPEDVERVESSSLDADDDEFEEEEVVKVDEEEDERNLFCKTEEDEDNDDGAVGGLAKEGVENADDDDVGGLESEKDDSGGEAFGDDEKSSISIRSSATNCQNIKKLNTISHNSN